MKSRGKPTTGRDRRWQSNPTLNSVYENLLGPSEPLPEQTVLTSVYAALDPDSAQIKIGISDNVARRMDELRERRPNLELLGTMRGTRNLERAMHGRFREYRREAYEWYSSEIAAELLPLLDAA